MKTSDARLITAALFALAISLPVSAWIQARQRALPAPVSNPASATSSAPAYQMLNTDQGIYRMDTRTGETSRLITTEDRWIDVSGN